MNAYRSPKPSVRMLWIRTEEKCAWTWKEQLREPKNSWKPIRHFICPLLPRCLLGNSQVLILYGNVLSLWREKAGVNIFGALFKQQVQLQYFLEVWTQRNPHFQTFSKFLRKKHLVSDQFIFQWLLSNLNFWAKIWKDLHSAGLFPRKSPAKVW